MTHPRCCASADGGNVASHVRHARSSIQRTFHFVRRCACSAAVAVACTRIRGPCDRCRAACRLMRFRSVASGVLRHAPQINPETPTHIASAAGNSSRLTNACPSRSSRSNCPHCQHRDRKQEGHSRRVSHSGIHRSARRIWRYSALRPQEGHDSPQCEHRRRRYFCPQARVQYCRVERPAGKSSPQFRHVATSRGA